MHTRQNSLSKPKLLSFWLFVWALLNMSLDRIAFIFQSLNAPLSHVQHHGRWGLDFSSHWTETGPMIHVGLPWLTAFLRALVKDGRKMVKDGWKMVKDGFLDQGANHRHRRHVGDRAVPKRLNVWHPDSLWNNEFCFDHLLYKSPMMGS